MGLYKSAILTFTLASLSFHSFAQDYKKNSGPRFSKEEMHKFLLVKSKNQRSKAIGAVVLGPILTGVGVYLSNKDPFTISGGSGSSISVRESNTAIIGKIIGTTGIITTLSSIPFFISAGKTKKEAMLVLPDESVSYLNKRVAVLSLGLHIVFR
jgi:hypothetical protein